MSDFRGDDPFRRDPVYDPNVRGGSSGWGWIASVAFIVAAVAFLFAFGHRAHEGANDRVANNTAPVVTHMAPPASAPADPRSAPASKNAPKP